MVVDLTEAEHRLIAAAEAGEVADYSTGEADQDDPAHGASWGAKRTLRAEVVRRLCLGLNPEWPVDPRGVRVRGAKTIGDFDVGVGSVAFPFELERCHIAGEMILRDATIMRVCLSGSWLSKRLNAKGLVTKGDLSLNGGVNAKAEVNLTGAEIGGDLDCSNGTFDNPDGDALFADRITVKGNVWLSDGFSANGEVGLVGADIGGSLVCDKGTFENPGGAALACDFMTIKGGVLLSDDFNAHGEVRLLGADIGRSLMCDKGTFVNPGGYTLNADGLSVKGAVLLRDGFSTKGEVRLVSVEIGANLECDKGTFENSGGAALACVWMTVKGNVFLRHGFSANGEVDLTGAEIGGDLDCRNGTFENPDGDALSAERIAVKRGVFLRNGFSAKGTVNLLGANIGGSLECDEGTFENAGGRALIADRITVKGDVFLRHGIGVKGVVRLPGANIGGSLEFDKGTFENLGCYALYANGMTVKRGVFIRNGFSAKGTVSLAGADIGGNLECRSARLETNRASEGLDDSTVFSLEAARIKGILIWRDLELQGRVTLAHAKVGGLFDDPNSWPGRGSLDLNGFEYDEFVSNAPTSAVERIGWLKRQNEFRAQPYEQAVRVLRRMGHDRDARQIAIAKQIALRQSGLLSCWGQTWNCLFEIFVGFGYQPWRAIVWALGFCVLGTGFFDLGFSFNLMNPADSRVFLRSEFIESGGTWRPPEYPQFKAPIYSLDVFLPIVDLHQESRWLPNMRNGWGWALWVYMWIHIMIGWVLTSVFVAALTGVIKKD